jgi:dihydropteroate synthase
MDTNNIQSNPAAVPAPLLWPDGQMEFGGRTYVMGIINRTPDSFYDGGRNEGMKAALAAAERMISGGADIIDVGGESTRPGAARVSAADEIARTVPFIRELRRAFPNARISIDTYKAAVASAAIEAGAGMINDISALRFDPDMARVAAESGAPVCLMHIQGTPADMQNNPSYPEGVVAGINEFFSERIRAAAAAGIREAQIVLDPGIGFGKTVGHNLDILNRLGEFRAHGRPLLVGASRKSFIGKTLDLDPDDRLEGSIAAAVIAVARGADIVRVHDVRETARAMRIADAITRRME